MPRNNSGAVAIIALMLLTWGQYSPAQEKITGGTDIDPSGRPQGGWVIEMGGDEPVQVDTEVQPNQTDEVNQAQVATPVRQINSGIEMIIGGQGDGGVAKRGTLPVVD